MLYQILGLENLQTECSLTDEATTPFPDSLSISDKSNFIKISGKYVARYHQDDISVNQGNNVGSVRSSNPIPSTCSIHYFEMTVLNAGKKGAIGIGLTRKGSRLNHMPGWSKETVGYHGDNGLVYLGTKLNERGIEYGPIFGKGDVVGCGIDFDSNTVFFTRNGISFGIVELGFALQNKHWYPTIGLHSSREKVKINFGQQNFIFNISEYAGNV